jgi:LacI family transcriptional regulator
MGKRVTLQEIADALGMSRNTVSRALNNSGSVSAETRNKISQMATAMGYKQFNMVAEGDFPAADRYTAAGKTEIALFTHSFPGASHSGTRLLEAFQNRIDKLGYKLSINVIRDIELENLALPANIDLDNIAGILCLELFSARYSSFLCSRNIPILFVDTPLLQNCSLKADTLFMENTSSVHRMLSTLIAGGKKKISFVGDRFHCQSFYERWQGYVGALTDNALTPDTSLCILDDDNFPYHDISWLSDRIRSLRQMPQVFFCANDFLATCVIKALKQLGTEVPSGALVCGFDNAPEATIIEPALTTVKIHSSSMGYTAADLLLSRIATPNMPFRRTYIETDVIFRQSTGAITN